ncbi:MAG: hypothetical protein ABSF54_09380 [Bryobacteraceae bacterium]|jgi:hypothetical protein
MNTVVRAFLSLAVSGCLVFLMAVPPSIGVIRSTGDFQVDGSKVSGNATLFEGSTVQTAAAQSKIQWSSGAQIVLEPNTRAQVYKDYLEAATLRISPADTHTVAEILTQDGNRVSVSASQGLVDVRNGAGVLVATVRPGLALAFTAQAGGASTATKMKGCLGMKNGHYFLTDQATGVTVELQGPAVAASAGHQVEISGSMIPGATPPPGASQVVQVVTIDSVGARCNIPGGAAVAGAGLGTGAIVAIVAGVAAVATVVGLAAAGTFSSSSKPAVSTP